MEHDLVQSTTTWLCVTAFSDVILQGFGRYILQLPEGIYDEVRWFHASQR